MTLHLRAPSRLHFGFLGWGPDAPRQFGSVGLMIERPGLELIAEPASRLQVEGPLENVVAEVARVLLAADPSLPTARFEILQAPRHHAGLGTGTQLALAVARILTTLGGRPDLSVATLAKLTARGRRSGIGLHGFLHGGLLVDAGRRTSEGIPTLIARSPFPVDWSILLLMPPLEAGLHGLDEVRAFSGLPPIPTATTDLLCRHVLLGLLPAVAEADFRRFGISLEAIQAIVGALFAPAQGGLYAHPSLESLAHFLRDEGFHGVGQSSWGPTLYGFTDLGPTSFHGIEDRLRARFGLKAESIVWSRANTSGAVLTV